MQRLLIDERQDGVAPTARLKVAVPGRLAGMWHLVRLIATAAATATGAGAVGNNIHVVYADTAKPEPPASGG